jgi:hypothetical protein
MGVPKLETFLQVRPIRKTWGGVRTLTGGRRKEAACLADLFSSRPITDPPYLSSFV